MDVIKKKMSLLPLSIQNATLELEQNNYLSGGDETIIEEQSLLNTIKLPKNLAQLAQRLPKSNYQDKTKMPKPALHLKNSSSKNNPRFNSEQPGGKQPGLPQISSMKEISMQKVQGYQAELESLPTASRALPDGGVVNRSVNLGQ